MCVCLSSSAQDKMLHLFLDLGLGSQLVFRKVTGRVKSWGGPMLDNVPIWTAVCVCVRSLTHVRGVSGKKRQHLKWKLNEETDGGERVGGKKKNKLWRQIKKKFIWTFFFPFNKLFSDGALRGRSNKQNQLACRRGEKDTCIDTASHDAASRWCSVQPVHLK